MRDEDLRGLRRLAETQGDAASWSRLAAAHVRLGQWDEAGEALVRARAVGEADPRVEDLCEEASLEDAVLTAVDRELGTGFAPTWSPDSQRVFFHADGGIYSWKRGDSSCTRVANTGFETQRLVCSLDSRFLVHAVLNASAIKLDTVNLATGSKSPEVAIENVAGFGRTDFAAWGPRGGTTVLTTRRVSSLEIRETGELRLLGSQHEEETVSLCWNGERARWGKKDAPLQGLPTLRAAQKFDEKWAVFTQSRVHGRTFSGVALSPAGRFGALWSRSAHEVEIVDSLSDRARSFRTPSAPHHAVWSPSGRRLAVALTEGLAIIELGADPLAALDAQWRAAIDDERHDDAAFFQRLETDKRPVVTEWLLRQLEPEPEEPSMPFRVASAARALRKRREPVNLERVRRARAKLPARPGGFRDYRGTVDRLIQILEGMARGERCECTAGVGNPAEHGSLEKVSEDIREGWGIFVYRCTVCGRRWQVTEDTGYHFPTYDAREIRD